jgi:hypothetical protein
MTEQIKIGSTKARWSDRENIDRLITIQAILRKLDKAFCDVEDAYNNGIKGASGRWTNTELLSKWKQLGKDHHTGHSGYSQEQLDLKKINEYIKQCNEILSSCGEEARELPTISKENMKTATKKKKRKRGNSGGREEIAEYFKYEAAEAKVRLAETKKKSKEDAIKRIKDILEDDDLEDEEREKFQSALKILKKQYNDLIRQRYLEAFKECDEILSSCGEEARELYCRNVLYGEEKDLLLR